MVPSSLLALDEGKCRLIVEVYIHAIAVADRTRIVLASREIQDLNQLRYCLTSGCTTVLESTCRSLKTKCPSSLFRSSSLQISHVVAVSSFVSTVALRFFMSVVSILKPI